MHGWSVHGWSVHGWSVHGWSVHGWSVHGWSVHGWAPAFAAVRQVGEGHVVILQFKAIVVRGNSGDCRSCG
ncbi:MAG: hypothetical protein N838_05260 [Thiohalocapsa sp. PB-PSB1]|nr:MAG: hypothetical protein N838_05260 [Thiohalocapsa sp. PB-PSB1]